MTFVDTPNKKQNHPHYEHRTAKLDKKNNEFSDKKFHKVRKSATHKKLLESFGKIGMCLNNKTSANIPSGDLDKVCFILINTYEGEDRDLGVGPLNDGYLFGLKHHRLGFKVFYLYNPKSTNYTLFLGYFMQNTEKILTVFYSGGDSANYGIHGIDFIDGTLHEGVIGNVISHNCNNKSRVIFITDSYNGGSVFDIHSVNLENNKTPTNLISFSIKKEERSLSKEIKRSQGIFTYYYCKIISDCPDVTPDQLVENINPSILRFNQFLSYDSTNPDLSIFPIFSSN